MTESIEVHPEDRINVPLLRKVVEHIEAYPERFDMGVVRRRVTSGDAEEFSRGRRRPDPICGSVGCIAGWTVLLAEGDPEGTDPYISVTTERARELLHLTEKEEYHLFFAPWEHTPDLSYRLLDDDPSLVRGHVEATLGIRL